MFKELTTALLLSCGVAGAASATTANLYDDITLTANPSGVWSHGYYDTPGDSSSFTLFNNVTNFVALPNPRETGGNSWSSQVVDGYIGYNANPTDYDVGQLLLPSEGVFMGPRSNGGETVVRWTAPEVGSFVFDGVFTDLQNVGLGSTPVGFSISTVGMTVNGGSPLFSTNLGTQFETFSIAQTLALSTGDTVDFWVNLGPDQLQSDTVGLALEVTTNPTTPVPLPGAGVFMIGALATFGFGRKLRRKLS